LRQLYGTQFYSTSETIPFPFNGFISISLRCLRFFYVQTGAASMRQDFHTTSVQVVPRTKPTRAPLEDPHRMKCHRGIGMCTYECVRARARTFVCLCVFVCVCVCVCVSGVCMCVQACI
jgi:hypothetical protein